MTIRCLPLTSLLLVIMAHICITSSMVLPPLNIAKEPDAESVYWLQTDPHICVLVSTYIGHGLKLTTLVASLLATEYPHLDIFLLDTDLVRDSQQWMVRTKALFNARWGSADKRKQVHIPPRTRKTVAELHPHLTDSDYGYLLSDYVIDDLQSGKYAGVPKCDYFMLTNGDNFYNVRLIPETLKYMREGYDLIAFSFSTRYVMDNELVVHRREPNQQLQVNFMPGAIDKGSAFYKATATHGMTFALRFIDKTGTRFIKRSDQLDGFFFQDLHKTPGVRSIIVPQLLFVHQ